MKEPSYVATFLSGELEARVKGLIESLASCELCPRRYRVEPPGRQERILQDQGGRLSSRASALTSGKRTRWWVVEAPAPSSSPTATCFAGLLPELRYQPRGGRAGDRAGRLGPRHAEPAGPGVSQRQLRFPQPRDRPDPGSLADGDRRGVAHPLGLQTGGYDLPGTIRRLEGVVDIYMPDVKFSDGAVAEELAEAPDYPLICRSALSEMHRQVGDLCLDEAGVAWKGLLIRHLVMPDHLAGTQEPLRGLRATSRRTRTSTSWINTVPAEPCKGILPCRDGSRVANTKKPSKSPDDADCIGSTNDEPSASSGADPLHHTFLDFPQTPQATALRGPALFNPECRGGFVM